MSDNLPKAYIFGSGSGAKEILPLVQEHYNVIALLDNNKNRWGEKLEGFNICDPNTILGKDYDDIIIASSGYDSIREQLLSMGVNIRNINTNYILDSIKSRINFLEQIGELFEDKSIKGCVAEGGVLQGDFAKEINRVFSKKRLYLFDTFSGFDARDVTLEREKHYSDIKANHLDITCEELVLNKLPHPDNCIIRKGYFPESAEDIDEVFCFVNLDFDLYLPTLAGIEYFMPRMVNGGIILIHDYFSKYYKGVKAAVMKISEESGGLKIFPIGDGQSIGILC